jgi:hypothetical protein
MAAEGIMRSQLAPAICWTPGALHHATLAVATPGLHGFHRPKTGISPAKIGISPVKISSSPVEMDVTIMPSFYRIDDEHSRTAETHRVTREA